MSRAAGGDLPDPAGFADPCARPLVTADIEGVGGRIKQRPEDFLVEEIPITQPCGSGEHIWMLVEKRDMSTLHMARVVARHFSVPLRDVGWAGLKDRRAITRQVISVRTPGRRPEDFPQLQHDQIAVLWVDLHDRKLRRGHLRGNRFSIRIRDVQPTGALIAQRALQRLRVSGLPGLIGSQRFGAAGVNHLVGRALLRGESQLVLDLLLGPLEGGAIHPESRRLYAEGRYAEALEALPKAARTERSALGPLSRGASAQKAVGAIPVPERRFLITAAQSAVFNDLLRARMDDGSWDRCVEGDLAMKLDGRATFAVTGADIATGELDARLARFEISPTGPMWGPQMQRATGAVDAMELEVLARFGLSPEALEAFPGAARGDIEGQRRPLRVPVVDPEVEGGVDEHGAFIRCAFDLPRGSFATEVMREIMKPADAAALTGGDF
ncbi:MAG: tRNA pseudouridine(13) synthase TruD [Phycisphaerales bacterium JB039]